jgi:hypothetical protein
MNKIFIIIGFSANYAAPVHEMYGSDIHWNKSGSGPGFFRAALYNNKGEIRRIIRENAEIKE